MMVDILNKFLSCVNSKVLKIILSVVCVWFLYSFIPFAGVLEIFKTASISLLLLASTIQVVILLINSWRWKMLLESPNVPPFFQFVKLNFMASFASIFLPSTLGGDVLKSLILGHQIKSQVDSAQSLLINRMIGFLMINLLFWISLIWGYEYIKPFPYVLMIMFAITCLLVIIIGFRKWFNKISYFTKIFVICKNWKKHGKKNLALASLLQFLQVVVVFIIAQSLLLPIPFSAVLVFVPLLVIMAIIPLTFFNIGVRESIHLLLFSSVGIDNASCIAMAMASYVIYLPFIFIGSICIIYHYREIKNIKKFRKKERGPQV